MMHHRHVVWQLSYCVVQFIEKDVTLSESVCFFYLVHILYRFYWYIMLCMFKSFQFLYIIVSWLNWLESVPWFFFSGWALDWVAGRVLDHKNVWYLSPKSLLPEQLQEEHEGRPCLIGKWPFKQTMMARWWFTCLIIPMEKVDVTVSRMLCFSVCVTEISCALYYT